jgi:hypothetical protein
MRDAGRAFGAADMSFPVSITPEPSVAIEEWRASEIRKRADAKARFRTAIRFLRQHCAQDRPDLAELMLSEAAAYRSDFRRYHHRFVAIEKLGGRHDL